MKCELNQEINELTLKAALIDAITFAKFKQHLAPNWNVAKKTITSLSGQPPDISNKKYMNLIGLVYRDNNLEIEFWKTIDKFKAASYL